MKHVLSSLILSLFVVSISGTSYSTTNSSNTRFLTYMVNPPEGFNLRRDVYVRVAVLIHRLIERGQDWVLVLPPWPHLYHWKSGYQGALPWSQFFDLYSLSHFIPVMDYGVYKRLYDPVTINRVWQLDTPDFLAEGYKFDSEFTSMACNKEYIENTYSKISKSYHDPFIESIFGDLTVQAVECYQVMGGTDVAEESLLSVREGEFVLLENFEMLMHHSFAGKLFWAARASMVYAEHLRKIGDEFMLEQLSFSSADSQTGDYLSVHLRRGDYLQARPSEIPSLDGAIKQIEDKLISLNLSQVFLATDSSQHEVDYIESKLSIRVVRYTPKSDQLLSIGDGGVSIVDQWIAAHARYFIGTSESTFSFRICEERQLIGIPVDTTYNSLCPDNEPDCRQFTRWNVVT